MRIRSTKSIKNESYSIPDEYSADIVPGLICKRKKGRDGYHYLVFIDETGRIKWWIVPNAYNEFDLLLRDEFLRSPLHYQDIKGKANELIDYIKTYEASRLGEMKISHTQVEVIYPFTGDKITVDETIKPLMELIWAEGIETVMCCIENTQSRKELRLYGRQPTRTFIAFANDGYVQFKAAILEELEHDDELVARINGDDGPSQIVMHWTPGPELHFPVDDFDRVLSIFKSRAGKEGLDAYEDAGKE